MLKLVRGSRLEFLLKREYRFSLAELEANLLSEL